MAYWLGSLEISTSIKANAPSIYVRRCPPATQCGFQFAFCGFQFPFSLHRPSLSILRLNMVITVNIRTMPQGSEFRFRFTLQSCGNAEWQHCLSDSRVLIPKSVCHKQKNWLLWAPASGNTTVFYIRFTVPGMDLVRESPLCAIPEKSFSHSNAYNKSCQLQSEDCRPQTEAVRP